jgi:hypothetical protein
MPIRALIAKKSYFEQMFKAAFFDLKSFKILYFLFDIRFFSFVYVHRASPYADIFSPFRASQLLEARCQLQKQKTNYHNPN